MDLDTIGQITLKPYTLLCVVGIIFMFLHDMFALKLSRSFLK